MRLEREKHTPHGNAMQREAVQTVSSLGMEFFLKTLSIPSCALLRIAVDKHSILVENNNSNVDK